MGESYAYRKHLQQLFSLAANSEQCYSSAMQHHNLVNLIRARVDKSTLTAVADEMKVSKAYLSEVLNGHKNIGEKILDSLGYEIIYRKRK